MGDRVAVMSDGELQQVDIPQRLYDSPANLFVAGFMGTPPMNLIQAQVQSQNGSVVLTVGPQSLLLSDETLRHYPGIRSAAGRPSCSACARRISIHRRTGPICRL